MHRTIARPTLCTLATLLWLVVVGCGNPFLLLPGGALEGPTVPAPDDWSFTEETNTVELETNPEDPYSVNLWVVALGEHLYVHAGANRSKWVEHLESDPMARMRIEGRIYALTAVRVSSPEEFDRFSDAYQEKYGTRPRNEDVAEAYLFRLSSR